MISSSVRRLFVGLGTVFTLASTLLAVNVYGQTDEVAMNFASMPNASVQGVTVTASDASSLDGTFTVVNYDTQYIGNLTFDYVILGPSPELKEGELVVDNAPVYVQIPSGVDLALGPKEEREVPFALNKIPTLPKGSYRLRIQLKTHDDRRLGWSDTDVTLGSDLAAFAVIKGGAIEVESVDPITNETRSVWAPFEGVNVDPGQSVTLKANTQNVGTGELTGTVILNVRKALSQTSEPEKINGPAVAIPASETQEISIPITAPPVPGAYEITGFITDGQGSIISSTAIYRVVVKGQSASIIRATIDTPATRANETATVSFSVVGSADRLTDGAGTIEVAILNDGVIVGETISTVELSSAPTDGVASVQLTEDARGTLGLRVTVKDQAGNVLATSTSAFEGVDFGGGWDKKAMLVVGILVITLIALAGVGMLWWHRHRSGPTGPTSGYTTAAALFLILGSVLLGSSALALSQADTLNLGNGIEFRKVTQCFGKSSGCYVERSMVYTNITPSTNIPYGSQVGYSIRHEWFACGNAVTNTSVVVKGLQGGGAHVNSLAQAGSLPWTTLATKNMSFIDYGGHNPYLFFYDFGFVYTFAGATTFPTTPYPNNISTLWTHGTTHIIQNSFNTKVDNDEFRWLTFAPVNNSTCTSLTVPATVVAGASFPAKATMLNNGSTPWITDATPHRLGFQNPQDTTRWGLSRVELPAGPAILYGQTAAFNFNATAPTTAGTYPFAVQMVEDGVQWFGTQCSQNVVVTAATPTGTPQVSATPTGTPQVSATPTPSATPPTAGADLGVTITAPASVARGSLISYSLQAINNGPQSASLPVVTVQIPANFTFNAPSSSSACSQQGSTIRCPAGNLAAGQSTLFAVVFTVGQNATCNSKVTNTASVTSATADPNSANNTATSGETTITCGQCQDGIDNDGDNRIDVADPACHDGYDINKAYNPTRASETDTQCTDKKDNDGDGVIDDKDPGCHVGTDLAKPYIPSHNNEAGIPPLDPGGFKETE